MPAKIGQLDDKQLELWIQAAHLNPALKKPTTANVAERLARWTAAAIRARRDGDRKAAREFLALAKEARLDSLYHVTAERIVNSWWFTREYDERGRKYNGVRFTGNF